MRRRGLCLLVLWAVVGLGVGLVGVTFATRPLGFRTLTVLSGSMSPAIETGDVVVTQKVSPEQLELRDVVTFRSPDTPGKLITHRVRKVRIDGDMVHVTTRGDANNNSEKWSVPTDGTVGLVRVRVPAVGYVLARIGNGKGRLIFFVAPVLLLALLELRRIWASEPTAKPEPDEPRRHLPVPVPARVEPAVTHYLRRIDGEGRDVLVIRPAARMVVEVLARRTLGEPLPAYDPAETAIVMARLTRHLDQAMILGGALRSAIREGRYVLETCGREAVVEREPELVG